MCGISGIWQPDQQSKSLLRTADEMAATLDHRGPDDSGTWVDRDEGIALSHRRLAILDLSPTGHQPMTSNNGRYAVVYNGELYNFRQLRKALADEAVEFEGTSDTEVLLAAIERWGILGALERTVGMFAFGLWDRDNRALWLARDRMGQKPLYYAVSEDEVVFGSQLHALARGGIDSCVDPNVLDGYCRRRYIPGEASLIAGVHRVRPGGLIEIRRNSGFEVRRDRYWDLGQAVRAAKADEFRGSLDAVVDLIEDRLLTAVEERMVADVPVGALLSGGLDSSLVTAMMQRVSDDPIQTFTIGFEEDAHDESDHARAISDHLGTEHITETVTEEDVLSIVYDLPKIYDEPLADPSQIPTVLLCRLAREHVKVALSGDGGDETFGGYRRYRRIRDLWTRVRLVPRPLRSTTAKLLMMAPAQTWDTLLSPIGGLLPHGDRNRPPSQRAAVLADLCRADGIQQINDLVVTGWRHQRPVRGADADRAGTSFSTLPGIGPVESLMYTDTRTYLPDDILVKVDRASMSVGLELRCPLLDHRLIETAWRLPESIRFDSLNGKRILRKILARYVPKELFDRPKSGFSVPLTDWLRGPLRDWADELLTRDRLEAHGLFVTDTIQTKWGEHRECRRDWSSDLWPVLTFQQWYDWWND